HTGRTNLYAAAHGVFAVDAARVNAINAIHESITIATLGAHEVVEPRQMLATIKIIPYAAPDWAVRKAEELARPGLVSVAAFSPKKIALISTTLPGMKAALFDKNKTVLAARAEALDSHINFETRCPHDAKPISAAIAEANATKPDMILIF